MGVEMTLQILHWLADGYGTDARITNIVDTREIWIVFAVNPDGAAYDISGRQVPLLAQEPPADTPGPRTIGTDLNRNYGYRLGRAAGARARTPRPSRTEGPTAFSAPETRAMRDFLT